MGLAMSFKKDFTLIIIGAILFTASLLWKDLITDIEETYFPRHTGIGWRFVYTIVVTMLLVLLAVHLKNVFGHNNSKINVGENPVNNIVRFDDDVLDKPIRADDDPVHNTNNFNNNRFDNTNNQFDNTNNFDNNQQYDSDGLDIDFDMHNGSQ